MKRLVAGLVAATVLVAMTAVASPFIGAGFDWGWPYLEAGWESLGFTGWARKYEPWLAGWWSFGLEGKTNLFFANFYAGGGSRVSIYLDNPWSLTNWHWGLYVIGEWIHQPLTIYATIYAPVYMGSTTALPTTWPFGTDIYISFGFRYLLWCGSPGESPCPEP